MPKWRGPWATNIIQPYSNGLNGAAFQTGDTARSRKPPSAKGSGFLHGSAHDAPSPRCHHRAADIGQVRDGRLVGAVTKERKLTGNKFRSGAKDGKHYWLTPPDLYAQLDAEFHFDFDPCPYPLPEGFDGLSREWGKSSYVNPPFGSIMHFGKKKGMTAWARKALAAQAEGKRVVMVYPIDGWVLMLLAAGAQVRNLGNVCWHSTEDGKPGKGTGRPIAMFVLEPKR